MKEVCTGFVGIRRSALDNLDLDKAPDGMEFSTWFLLNTIYKKKHAISVKRSPERLLQ